MTTAILRRLCQLAALLPASLPFVAAAQHMAAQGTVCRGSQFPEPRFVTGQFPTSVASGDLDGDGSPDLAVANRGNNTVSVLLNGGTASFGTATIYPTGLSPNAIALANLDGDADVDMVVTNQGSNTVSVYLNTGTGTFSSPVNYSTGSQPFSVAIGTLDGNSSRDLVVANVGSNTVSVFRNQGNGTFTVGAQYATALVSYSVALGDMNGDSIIDIAVGGSSASACVSVLRNLGNAMFAAPVSYGGAGAVGYAVAIGDLDGDGDRDLGVASSGGIRILTNQNNGTFGPPTIYMPGSLTRSVGLADLVWCAINSGN